MDRTGPHSPPDSKWGHSPAEGDAARTAALAQSSAVIEALGMSVVDDPDDARWLVRVILSLLTVPGRDDEDERAMVERYVAPRVTSAP